MYIFEKVIRKSQEMYSKFDYTKIRSRVGSVEWLILVTKILFKNILFDDRYLQ